MRLLVTGGSGFIGSNLVRLALRRGHEVLNLDKLSYAANPASLADVESDPAYRFVHADICDAEAVREAFSGFAPVALVHLAAETHVDRSIDAPDEFIRTNITGTFTLLQAARDFWADPQSPIRNPRFLHVSTDEVFGSLGSEGRFAETDRYDPHSPYSASKAASDHLVRAWGDTYGLPVVVAHCSNNYGPWQFPEKLIPLVILRALRGESIPVYGTGENVRDWLYVEDQAEALLAMLEKGRPGESYNIAGGNELPNIDLVRRLCRVLDEVIAERRNSTAAPKHGSTEALIRFVADRPGHDFRYALDTGKARAELGWQPRESIDTGLRKTVEWYLANESWWRPILDGTYQLQRLGLGDSVPV